MPLDRRVTRGLFRPELSARTPRVGVVRESLWHLPVPRDARDRALLHDRRGQLVLAALAVHSDAADAREFDAFVAPVLRGLASSRSRAMLVLRDSAATFDAGRTRHMLQAAHERGLLAMVEIDGEWPVTLLELLAAAAPTYLRLSPTLVHGAATVPDLFRALVVLAEFGRDRAVQLVARNPRDDQEVDALRSAGIGLLQWCDLPLERGTPDAGRRWSRP